MHVLSCQRRNFRCPDCSLVMQLPEKEKHMALCHTPFACECGAKFAQFELQIHREHDCKNRLVKCLYCPLRIPLETRGAHQERCGSRTVHCSHCDQTIQRKDSRNHLSNQHNLTLKDMTQSAEWSHFK